MIDVFSASLPYIKEGTIPKSYTLFKEGDVAFADASEDTNDVAKAIEVINCDGQQIVSGLHTIHGRDNSNQTVIGYKGYAFASDSFHKQIRRIAQGTKVFSISIRNFDEVYIGVPSKDEQTKIAKLLIAIDERIATQNKIIEDLKKLKSAIIEIEYSPKDSYHSHIGGAIVQISKRNKDNHLCNVLSVSNRQGFIKQSEQFEDRNVASDDTSNYKIVEKNDFAYNPARINVGSIARLTKFETGIVSPMYICFRTKDCLLPEYLELFFESRNFFYHIQKRLEGSVRLCLSYEELCNIPIVIPSIEKQKQVDLHLSKLAQKIDLEMKILQFVQQQKTYLLHQMFI